MSLRAWLDAGERFIMSPIEDPLARDIFGRLFEAESQQSMEDIFAELGALGESLTADAQKLIDKERNRRNVHRRVSRDEMAAAFAEWGGGELPEGWGETNPESPEDGK